MYKATQRNNFDDLLPFSIEQWIEIQRHLTVADVVMRELSKKYSLKFLSNQSFHGGGLWPTRRLQRKIGWRLIEVKISLNSNYLQDHKLFFELIEHVSIECCGWFSKSLSHEKLKQYSSEQINNLELLQNDLESIVSCKR